MTVGVQTDYQKHQTTLSPEGGIHLTQVGWENAADRQGLPGLVRGAAGVVS
jgi:hypothetical protein